MLEKLTIPALRRTGNPEDAELADVLAARVRERGDFPLSDGKNVIKKEESPLGLLEQAVKEFKEKPHTPEIVTNYWQTPWKVWGEKVDLSFVIPSCDRTTEEIRQLEKEGRKLVYVPDELASQENRHLLGSIFPEMQSHSLKKDNFVTNESSQGGWFDIEASLDSPNLDTREKDLESRFKKQGKVGQRLNVYIVGSQDAKLQTGHYFDEKTVSRLLGSRVGGHVVDAYFYVNGNLNVNWNLNPQDHNSDWGGRSEGAKKA